MSQHGTYVHAHDAVHWFMNELSSRVVAESGIASDRDHMGKLILRSLKDAPDFVMQIDGATGESETFGSALERSVRCALCLTSMGIQKDDVIILMAPNHIDLAIPFYAALYLGVIIAAIDINLGIKELQDNFLINMPKLIFCHNNKVLDVQAALKNCQLEAKIITFDEGTHDSNFSEFMAKYCKDDLAVENFKPTDFDPADTIALITATSGTTGLPKGAALTHKNVRYSIPYNWLSFSKFPTPTRMVLIVSPLQWLSAGFNYLFSPILRYTRLQTSKPTSIEEVINLVKTYKPTYTLMTSTLLIPLLKQDDRCDFSSFEQIHLAGSAVSLDVLQKIKEQIPNVNISNRYGLSEVCCFSLYDQFPLNDSVGKPTGLFSYRLVDVETGKDIFDPNIPGELWLKGPSVFKGYYNNPQATEEAIVEDGWIRTGDILYRDHNWNFYFVERLKLLLKYKNYQVSPTELESVIRAHPGVQDVAVTGIPDVECGDLPVACVVVKPGYSTTAQEIKNLVKDSLAESKQLRGGVIFMDELPTTVTTKINRKKLKQLVLTLDRE